MNKNIFGALMFVAGAAIGAIVTARVVKAKYEKFANEEIKEVREYYASKNSEKRKEELAELERIENLDGEEKIEAYYDMLKKEGYIDDSSEQYDVKKKAAKTIKKDKEPVATEERENTVLIAPEEFGEEDEETGEAYDLVTLVYYADGVLTYYDNESLVDDIEGLVGTEFKDHFGDYEEDVVFVRNHRNETDYEIIKDRDKYYDIWPKGRVEEDE